VPSWTGIGPLAGVAQYGIESAKNLFITNMQCDTVWIGCIYLGESDSPTSNTPSMVTNVAQKCTMGFANVWPSYVAVLLAPGITGTAVSNVAAKPNACQIANTHLVSYQSSIYEPSLDASVAQDPSGQFCASSLGFASSRYYTIPITSAYTNFQVAANKLYAIPVQIPCGITIERLSTYINTIGSTGASCEYGIYGGNGAGLPGALILDAGSIAATSLGSAEKIGLNQQVGPGLYFLVVGCNSVMTEPQLNASSASVTLPGTLLGGLLGLTSQTATNAFIVGTGWTFGALPSPAFTSSGVTISYASSSITPLMYFRIPP
jgi:hypothetical protein